MNHFLKEVNDGSNHVWALSRMKTIEPIASQCVRELLKLEPLKYIKITPNSILASNKLAGKKLKTPETKPFDTTGIGVHLIFDFQFKIIEFCEINSATKGWGEKIVNTVLTSIPTDWRPTVIFDYSNGFWTATQTKFKESNWVFF